MSAKFTLIPLGLVLACLGAGTAFAVEPQPWQMGLQPANSPVAEKLGEFHDMLTLIITVITLFVLALLIIVVVRFNRKANPVPSKVTHNTLLEIIWTAAPVMILVIIAIPSVRLLYYMDHAEEAEMTIKIVGHQWYWSYEYPDHGEFTFDSFIVGDDDLKEGQPRLLTVDNEVVVPVGTTIRLTMTSEDVIHSWAVPSLGVKLDTVPGRLNETWVKVNNEGRFYGQCSELCGVNHGFMPITVRAVSKDEFTAWVKTAQEQFAKVDQPQQNQAKALDTAMTQQLAKQGG